MEATHKFLQRLRCSVFDLSFLGRSIPHIGYTRSMPEVFVKRTRFPVSAERLFAWHAEPDALKRLMPPWEQARVVRRIGTIRDVGSQIEIRVRIGPFWRTWISEHTACQEGRMFRDRQIKGPFAVWQHTHSFEPDGPFACYLEDRVEYALPMGALGKIFAGRLVRRKLDRLFSYRHEFTAEAIGASREAGKTQS